ncbi:hypothetical protein ACKFKF_28655 [Phormidesmis sp. 146-12]
MKRVSKEGNLLFAHRDRTSLNQPARRSPASTARCFADTARVALKDRRSGSSGTSGGRSL